MAKKRTRADVAKLTDVCEEAVLQGLPRDRIRALMGKAAGDERPIGPRALDRYLARVAERHKANPVIGPEEAHDQAIRRAQRMITKLTADGSLKNASAIARWEAHLAKLQGAYPKDAAPARGGARRWLSGLTRVVTGGRTA